MLYKYLQQQINYFHKQKEALMKHLLLLLACASIPNTAIFASQNPTKQTICGEFTAHELLHMMIDTKDMNTAKAEKIINNCDYSISDNCQLFSKTLMKNRKDLVPLILQLETKVTRKGTGYSCDMTSFITHARTHPDPTGMAELLYSKGFRLNPLHHCIDYSFVPTNLRANPACRTFHLLEEQHKTKEKKSIETRDQQKQDRIIAHLKKIE